VKNVLLFSAMYCLLIQTRFYLCLMNLHIGKKVKEELQQQGISVSVFAKKINRSRNVVYDIFERESIDTDLLQKISEVLKYNFFNLYNNYRKTKGEKTNTVSDVESSYHTTNEYLQLLEQKNKALENEVVYLKKIISLMEGDKKPKEYKKPKKRSKN